MSRPLDLHAIRERLRKITAWPWVAFPNGIDQFAPHPDGQRLMFCGADEDAYSLFTSADCEFIAHAPEDLAALLARVERLEAALATAVPAGPEEREALRKIREIASDWLHSSGDPRGWNVVKCIYDVADSACRGSVPGGSPTQEPT